MTHLGIARRMIATHGFDWASLMARYRLQRALRRGNDITVYAWHRIGALIAKEGAKCAR